MQHQRQRSVLSAFYEERERDNTPRKNIIWKQINTPYCVWCHWWLFMALRITHEQVNPIKTTILKSSMLNHPFQSTIRSRNCVLRPWKHVKTNPFPAILSIFIDMIITIPFRIPIIFTLIDGIDWILQPWPRACNVGTPLLWLINPSHYGYINPRP